MNAITFRKASLDDRETLLELEQKVIDAERPFNTAIKTNDTSYYDLEHLIVGVDSYLVVGEIGGKIVGTGYSQIRESKKSLVHAQHAYLGFMYVDPRYRGMRINNRLIEVLIEWSKAQGVSDFYLDVYDGNEAATRAYEKAGFEKSLVEMKLSFGE